MSSALFRGTSGGLRGLEGLWGPPGASGSLGGLLGACGASDAGFGSGFRVFFGLLEVSVFLGAFGGSGASGGLRGPPGASGSLGGLWGLAGLWMLGLVVGFASFSGSRLRNIRISRPPPGGSLASDPP